MKLMVSIYNNIKNDIIFINLNLKATPYHRLLAIIHGPGYQMLPKSESYIHRTFRLEHAPSLINIHFFFSHLLVIDD